MVGLDDSLQLVEKTLKEHGPFDGIVGFSQGGSLCSHLLESGILNSQNIKFAIFCSSYEFSSSSLQEKTQKMNDDLSSLHVFSPMDRMIRSEKSEKLAQNIGGVIEQHDAGHHIPVPWFHDVLHDFLIEKKLV